MQLPFYEFIKAKCQNALKVSSICSIFGRTMLDSRASAELAPAGFSILLMTSESKDLKTGSAQTVLAALFILLLENAIH